MSSAALEPAKCKWYQYQWFGQTCGFVLACGGSGLISWAGYDSWQLRDAILAYENVLPVVAKVNYAESHKTNASVGYRRHNIVIWRYLLDVL